MERARLFKSGNSQAVRLPKSYRFDGGYVWLQRVGSAVMLIPVDDAWSLLEESLALFTDDVFAEREQPPQAARESAFA